MKIFISLAIGLLLSFSLYANDVKTQPNELFVKLRLGQNLPNIQGAEAKHLFENWFLLQGKNIAKRSSEIYAMDEVESVELNQRSEKSELAKPTLELPTFNDDPALSYFNDPKASKVWSFRDSANNGVSVEKAYSERGMSRGETIRVAVVDTGVDYTHEDLNAVMWTNAEEIAGNGIDDDNNGYIDDIHGIDTLERDNEGKATGDPMDTHSHGSHVSGTIGAKQNNNVGIAGIAGNVEIMAIRTVPNSGDETDVDVVESFLYAAKNGARIINCSFGKRKNEGGMIVRDAIAHIGENYNVLVVAAAGNETSNIDNSLRYPASFDNENLLVVASTTSRGGMSYFSNYGLKNVDLAAPGSSIYSTTPGNKYASFSGTSMASPTTAGVAAQILSQSPQLTAAELKTLLMETVTKRSSFAGKMQSAGTVDLFNGLENL